MSGGTHGGSGPIVMTGTTLRLIDQGGPRMGNPAAPGQVRLPYTETQERDPDPRADWRGSPRSVGCSRGTAVTDWSGYQEKYGQPLRVGKYDPAATEADIDALLAAVANLGTDAAAVIPSSMLIELVGHVSGSSGGSSGYEDLCNFMDRQVSKGVLGQTMTTDDGSSRSQAEVHERVRVDLTKADAKQLADTINRDLIVPYIQINRGMQARYPRLTFPVVDPTKRRWLMEVLKNLVPLGLRVDQSVVRDRLGLPDPSSDAELLEPPSAPMTAANRALAHALNREGAHTDEIGRLAEASIEGWRPQWRPVVNPVMALAREADSADAFLAGLPALMETMDVGQLIEALATATFESRGLGDATDEPS